MPPSVHRLPFLEEKKLTEQDVIELSRQALILDGKRSAEMHPISSGFKDGDGRDLFFVRHEDKGWILWWLQRPDRIWDYSVGIERIGHEVVCTIVDPP